jgi:YggT family protein
MIFVRCFLTWFPNINWNNPLLAGLRASVDLYLDLFRKIIPPIGGAIDISPIVASFVLIFIRNGIIIVAAKIMGLV